MPEGHTLLRLARRLDAAFAGRVLRAGSPQGRFAESAARLDGSRLVEASSYGKHLFLRFDEGWLVHVHLGLYGSFQVTTDVEEVPDPWGQVRLRLVADDERGRSFADLRGATRCDLVTDAERDAVLARIGPDPLKVDATPERAWEKVRRSRRPIGALLMDQAVLAGVGNVYRAEVLFRHRIDPWREGRSLRVGQFRAVWDDLVVLMAAGACSGRIETVRPEDRAAASARPPRRRTGMHYVYRRDGEACLHCGTVIRTAEITARNVFWCPRCQPAFRSRAVG